MSRFPAVVIGCVLLAALALGDEAVAQRFMPNPYATPAGKAPGTGFLRDVAIEQHLDTQLPLDLKFRDETGKSVALGEFFNTQPVVLQLVYYRCPMLCTQVLNGFLKASQAVPLEIGQDYQVVTVSVDPEEPPELAAEKKASYVRAYRRPGAAQGWHFLTGDAAAIEQLAEAAGFRYRYDPESKQFAHAAGIMIATPDGKLSRYLYGIEFPPAALRLGLIESSAGKIGSPVDQFLLLCYHYDPLTGRYGLMISRVLMLAGMLTALSVGTFIVVMLRRERRRAATEAVALAAISTQAGAM